MILEDFNQIKNSSIDWNRFANKTILITGANGFLPAYMVEILLLLNNDILKYSPCKVIALVRNEKHTKERFSNYLSDENLKIIVQDVANEINLIEKIDYIVHAASPASPKYYNIDPVGVIMPNILGTKNTLELARKNNIEGYIYFSSGEVYGQLNDGKWDLNYICPIDSRMILGLNHQWVYQDEPYVTTIEVSGIEYTIPIDHWDITMDFETGLTLAFMTYFYNIEEYNYSLTKLG